MQKPKSDNHSVPTAAYYGEHKNDITGFASKNFKSTIFKKQG